MRYSALSGTLSRLFPHRKKNEREIHEAGPKLFSRSFNQNLVKENLVNICQELNLRDL